MEKFGLCHPERSEGFLQLYASHWASEKLRRSFAALRMTGARFLHTFEGTWSGDASVNHPSHLWLLLTKGTSEARI